MRWGRRLRSERGQVLILFSGMFLVIAIAGAISVDVGYWFSERRGISRATDLSALAATQDLPDSRSEALATALDFARRNGYEDGVEGTEVEVTFFCGNSIPNPPPGICRNPAAPFLSICTAEVGCDALEVKIHRPGRAFFSSIFGVEALTPGYASLANVKFNLKPIDVALLVDATSSMGVNSGLCNGPETNNGCPIKEARDAANRFNDILLDSPGTLAQVGYVPYRGCFNPPKNTWSGTNPCIRDTAVSGVANVTGLSSSGSLLTTEIDQTRANVAGSGTNTCWPLRRARTILANSANLGSAEQFVVLLADGNNVYNSEVFQTSPASPPATPNSCRPTSPTSDDSDLSADCNDTFTREASLDDLTWDRGKDLEADGVEVYVVGFNVCGADQPCRGMETDLTACPAVSANTCESQIGLSGGSSSRHDNQADRRLLKCIASSLEDTNSHYFEVSSASQLPSIFQIVAFEIASRGLAEGP